MKTYLFDASALFVYLQKTAGVSRVNKLLKQAIRGPALY
jgi:PIN domain nuclease of toxin-antitoxin system